MARKLRVLLLIPHLRGGGAAHVTALLARGLSAEKYEIHLALITQNDGATSEVPREVAVHPLGARRVRGGAIRLVRLVRRLKPDVILSGMAHLNFLVLLLRPLFPRATRVPTRILVRQNATVSSALAFGGLPWYTRLLYRRLYCRADRVICQSKAMAEDLARELGIDESLLAVLPNPVDFEGIRSAVNAPAHPSPSLGPGQHLLAVGRLSPEKGFDLLIRAMAEVRKQFPQADLLILGAGAEERNLKALCDSLDLDAAVHFAGHVENPYAFFGTASLFVLSSRHEGMPNALLEAAAAGMPIVSTPASGGIADLLRERPGAWLASEISVSALASALVEALSRVRTGQRFSPSLPAHECAIEAYEQLIDLACPQNPTGNYVALVIPTLDPIAGAERQVMLLANGLHQRGWKVSVIALSGAGGSSAAALRDAGILFLSLAMRKGLADPRGWIRFICWLRRARPDVVHAHLPHAAWLARWSRLVARVPIEIDTLHSSFVGPVGRRIGYRISRWLPDRVTSVSQAVADSHLAAAMVGQRTLAVLSNGVDTDEWRPDADARAEVRRELSVGDEFLWIAVGRLDPVKDYATLLHAMARIQIRDQIQDRAREQRREQRPARLLIAGEGPLRDDLARLAAQLGVEQRVTFLGFRADLKRWVQAADGFVLASRWEGLPVALLEAAACGVPAVATDVPGTREAIVERRTGFLVEPANADALAAAMTAMAAMPEDERRALGACARQFMVDRFSLASTLDRWEDLYRSLLTSRSRSVATDERQASF